MSEEVESGTSETADLVGISLALTGASREKADAFLDDQRHHIHEQLRQIHLDLFEKWLGVLLRLGTLTVGIAAAIVIGLMVWDAVHSSGLLIEPFSVPPDLAQRGLTGQVVAARLLDRLNDLQTETSSQRAPKSYAHSWGPDDIKIDIPETGVSLGQLESFLREKLGHDIHVSGEIVRTQSGLSLTVRAGADGSAAITGADTDTDALLQKLAESVYRITQPYRYGIYLGRNGHSDEAIAIFRQLALSGSDEERAWGYNGWQFQSGHTQLVRTASELAFVRSLRKKSLELNPNFVLGWENTVLDEEDVRPEAALADERRVLSLLSGDGRNAIRPDAIPYVRLMEQASIDRALGAYADAAREDGEVIQRQGGRLGGSAPSYALVAMDQAEVHDLDAARATLAEPFAGIGLAAQTVESQIIQARQEIARQAGDWARVRAQANEPAAGFRNPELQIALQAYADARLGHLAAAEREIAATPADCYPCLIDRAGIAVLQSQQARADFWFARAVESAPSIPHAYSQWGQALLERGKPDDAISKFRLANQKGPHFADPLEGWGEALMAKNRSHLALAKFEGANKYAPNWGRLHLKWGEALAYSGKPADAKAQFTRAAQLDLTPAEKAELAAHLKS